MKRIAKHKISNRISGWSVFFLVIGILAIIMGFLVFIIDITTGEPEIWYYGLGGIFLGLQTLAVAKIIEGFSIVVHNAEQQSVDSGDNTYLDFVRTEEEKQAE